MRQPSMAMRRLTSEFPGVHRKRRLLTLSRYGHSLVQFDPRAEAKLRWKIDLYIVPTVSLLYLFCFIDRANIGKSP